MGVTNDDDEVLAAEAMDDEDIEGRMRAWALPIAERVLAVGAESGFTLPRHFIEPGSTPQEALASWIGAVTMMFMGEGPTEFLPRAAQEAGTGTLRFRRDEGGELCFTIDERPDITERMCIRDPIFGMFTGGAGPLSLPTGMLTIGLVKLACEEVEKAILAGEAYLMAFRYDAAKSTPEEAVYVRSPAPGEVEQEREAWATHDQNVAAIEADRKRRISELKAKLAGIDPKIERLLGTPDDRALYLAYSLLVALFESFIYEAFYDLADSDERQLEKAALTLRRDGRIDNGVQVVPSEYVFSRLENDIGECWLENGRTPPAPFDARRVVAWGIEAGRLVPDLFEGMTCAPDPDGLRVTLGPIEE